MYNVKYTFIHICTFECTHIYLLYWLNWISARRFFSYGWLLYSLCMQYLVCKHIAVHAHISLIDISFSIPLCHNEIILKLFSLTIVRTIRAICIIVYVYNTQILYVKVTIPADVNQPFSNIKWLNGFEKNAYFIKVDILTGMLRVLIYNSVIWVQAQAMRSTKCYSCSPLLWLIFELFLRILA